jgi:TPR repeat protein
VVHSQHLFEELGKVCHEMVEAETPAGYVEGMKQRAEKGDLTAMVELGVLYNHGHERYGVPQDFDRAKELLAPVGHAGRPLVVHCD